MALRSVPVSDKQATLGALIARVEKDDLLKKMKEPLSVLKTQRNYLFHNVFALLSGVIEETILEGSNLLDSDVATYQERAWVLTDNLNGMADIVERKKAHITNRSSRPAHKGAAG